MRIANPIVIIDYEEMLSALAAAEALGVVANLVTPPEAAWVAGPLYWQSMIEDARENHPGVTFRLIADCGEDAGVVMKSLSVGLQYVSFTGEPEVASQLAEMAKAYEAWLVDLTGEGLDLQTAEDKEAACAEWLGRNGVADR